MTDHRSAWQSPGSEIGQCATLDREVSAEVCVIGVADPRWGEVGRAVVVAARGCALDGAAVLSQLGQRLARYKIPKSVVFTDELPHNAAGKVARQEVRDRFR